jgi:hypothetical protein
MAGLLENNESERMWKEVAMATYYSRYFLSKSESTRNDNHDSQYQGSRFEAGTFKIRSRSAIHSTAALYPFLDITRHNGIHVHTNW